MTELMNQPETGPQWIDHKRIYRHRGSKLDSLVQSMTGSLFPLIFTLIVSTCSIALIESAQAEQSGADGERRNHVQLSAFAQRAVTNEEISVTLATEHRGRKPAELARLANEDLAWATELIDRKKSVTVVAGNYQTFPLYEQKRQDKPTWQLVQEIVVRSQSIADVTELLGELQSRLQIRGTQFSITPQTRRKVENELIEDAMSAFHERAAVIGRTMPTSRYEIVEININTGSSSVPDYRMHRGAVAMETMQMDAGMAAPTVEAGQATIAVHINGTVVYP